MQQTCSTCVDGHAHSEAIEEDLPPRTAALQVPNTDCASHLVLCQLDGPLLLQQPLLHMQAVAHLHNICHPTWGIVSAIISLAKQVSPTLSTVGAASADTQTSRHGPWWHNKGMLACIALRAKHKFPLTRDHTDFRLVAAADSGLYAQGSDSPSAFSQILYCYKLLGAKQNLIKCKQ